MNKMRPDKHPSKYSVPKAHHQIEEEPDYPQDDYEPEDYEEEKIAKNPNYINKGINLFINYLK